MKKEKLLNQGDSYLISLEEKTIKNTLYYTVFLKNYTTGEEYSHLWLIKDIKCKKG